MADKPMPLRRVGRRFLCTFLPFLVRPQGGATTADYWNAYPSSDFGAIGPASQALLDEVTALCPDPAAPMLDMGCNVGRHLDYLYRKGYRNLRGVDFSSSAILEMKTRYPEMHRDSRITVAAFQEFLSGHPEPVDLVYTRGATFELVHPGFPLVPRVCALARKHVVMVISETGHAYPRFWIYEFARAGFELAHLRRPASDLAREHDVSLLTFRRIGA